MRRVHANQTKHLNLKYIHKLLCLPKRDRTKDQIATLVKYLKTMKIFKDMLVREGDKKEQAQQIVDAKDDDACFEHLATAIRVLTIESAGELLMEEGSTGD